jgi:two-component system CheB/CheR fusion protein
VKENPTKAKPRPEEPAPALPKGGPAIARTQQFKPGFPVVGIGASAGGLEALEEFFDNMPHQTGMAFVVVTHQHPGHLSLLPELLARQTGMSVIEAADNTFVEPNHVYVGPPAGYLTMVEGKLRRTEIAGKEIPRLPIDYFFRSLASDQKERAICIVLSGTGTDGTLGLKAVKSESGMCMVQSPDSAKYSGMPASAIDTGLADYVLAPRDMPRQLIAYAKGPYLTAPPAIAEAPPTDNELPKIFTLLRARTGNDFSAYKSNTIRRRIERRMNLHQIKKTTEYVRYLHENPHEIDILFKELLISVTNFFRDPDGWEALRPYLEDLVASRTENQMLRVWVPGCATGEEAFSLAIMLRECMDKVGRHLLVQIFGTDLDSEAIEVARSGLYPDGIAGDVSAKRLERYFIREDGTYRIRKEIREMTVFAPQNVIKHPPFTKLDLLSCRNLLIYLNSDLQKKLLPIFHYALKPGGLMFLGSSETVGTFTDLFESLDKRWKIFRRKESVSTLRALPEFPVQRPAGDELAPSPVVSAAGKEVHISMQIQRALLNRFTPASVVVNERGDILFIHGRTGMYLEPTPGEPRHNVLDMAREGLKIELPAALRECARKGKDVTREDIRVKANGDFIHVNLTVTKISEPEQLRGLLLVAFTPTPPPTLPERVRSKGTRKKAGDVKRIEYLERELQHVKESHQTTLEELETSNEELKSANEELQSINEELQSTNEELETSKEEMQSLNEELTTVNAELQSKVDELSRSNDDMQNLLNSTDIATVFLDNNLNIKRFTDKARELVMLRPTDVGRPISDLTSNVQYDGLSNDCREVLHTLAFKQAEVRTTDGKYYLMRIMPYRTAENVIDGIVLTFVNVGQLKESEKSGKDAAAYFSAVVDTVREPLLVLDGQLRVVSANRSFYDTFHTTAKQTVGELIYELAAGQWDIPKLRGLLEDILPKDTQFRDYKVDVEFPRDGHRVFSLNARRLEQPSAIKGLILLAMEDVTGK